MKTAVSLPDDIAALLREALKEAYAKPTTVGSYIVLKETIENLLEPLPEASAFGIPCRPCSEALRGVGGQVIWTVQPYK